MADRKSILLRLNPHIYAALQRWAADEFRSVNGQIEYLLDQALRSAGRRGRRAGAAPQRPEAGDAGGAGDGEETEGS